MDVYCRKETDLKPNPCYVAVRMRTIVFLSGWAGSGKDTVADYLAFHYGFQRIAFGDFLKRDVAKEKGIPLAAFYDRGLKDTVISGSDNKTPRDLLLAHARKVRAVDLDVYARQAVTEILALDPSIPIVISDWRYRRELHCLEQYFHREGIITVRIERAGIAPSLDETENDLNSFCFDHTIRNDGGIQKLYESSQILVPAAGASAILKRESKSGRVSCLDGTAFRESRAMAE
jgi:hypothetical protein